MVRFYEKKYSLAEQHIRGALLLKPNNPTFHYHFARIQAAAGKDKQALLTLQELHATGQSFPEKKEALFSYNKKQSFGLVQFDTTADDPSVRASTSRG